MWTDLLTPKNVLVTLKFSPGWDLRARRALLQDIISAWSESEGNFDNFQSIDS